MTVQRMAVEKLQMLTHYFYMNTSTPVHTYSQTQEYIHMYTRQEKYKFAIAYWYTSVMPASMRLGWKDHNFIARLSYVVRGKKLTPIMCSTPLS